MSGRRTTGRPKLKWGDVTRKYTKSKEFKDRKHKTGELGEMKTRCANPRIGQMPRNRYAELATYVDKSSFVWDETKRGKRLSLTGKESHSDEAPHRGESVNTDTPCRGNSPMHSVWTRRHTLQRKQPNAFSLDTPTHPAEETAQGIQFGHADTPCRGNSTRHSVWTRRHTLQRKQHKAFSLDTPTHPAEETAQGIQFGHADTPCRGNSPRHSVWTRRHTLQRKQHNAFSLDTPTHPAEETAQGIQFGHADTPCRGNSPRHSVWTRRHTLQRKQHKAFSLDTPTHPAEETAQGIMSIKYIFI